MKPSEGQVDIYLSLDEALDIVAATVNVIDPAVASQVINETYPFRTTDIFPGIDPAVFRERYAKRDTETLMSACMSNIYQVVKRLSQSIVAQMGERPYYKSAKIVVNYHPYVISDEVLVDIQKALYLNFGQYLKIELVNWPLEILTPEKCKKELGVMIMYNPQEWLNLHMPALEQNPMPEVILLTAQIHHVGLPSEQELETLREQGATPFFAFEMMMRPLVSVDLIEAHYFSIVNNAA